MDISPGNQSNNADDSIPTVRVEIVGAAPWEEQGFRPPPPQPAARRRRRRLPALLFAATCLSTLWVGTQLGGNGEDTPAAFLAAFLAGLRYAVPLMTILFCHEMGHYLQARRYRVPASLPYFIPVPLEPIGTFGAVIGMAPRIGGRRALFDIGITGPLAGLVPTLVFCVWGLYLSKAVLVWGHPRGWVIGEPYLFQYLIYLRFGSLSAWHAVNLDPMAYAGWVGLLITSLNLIPIGQLDGGHVLYALLREKAHRVASLLLFAALFLVILHWRTLGNWALMLILLFLLGPLHPPTANDAEPLGAWRTVLGWLTLAFVVIGFTPTPFRYYQ
jgi:membrane-associated protease RseP (regulator of RpoE activity)